MRGKDDSNYAYVTVNVRAVTGNLLKVQEYHALLGCSKPLHLIDVLTQTRYRQHLKPGLSRLDIASIRQIIQDSFISSLEQVISSTPNFAAPLFLAYRELLESWGLVNAFRTSLFRGNFVTESQIIPCGVLERSFYEMLSNDLSRALRLISLREAFREDLS